MNILLILRAEILSVIICGFLIIYNEVCKRYRNEKDYFRFFSVCAFGHSIMGLITEITVNLNDFPVWINNIFHILFFVFALLFSLAYFRYSLSLITLEKEIKKYIVPAYIISFLFIIVMCFSKIEYLEGNGTKYSAGIGPTLCYTLGFLLFIASDIVLIINNKRINSYTFITVLPLSFLGIGLMLIQIIVPEFLFTSGSLTIICIGCFFAIENPIGKFRNRAFIDAPTSMWNRNCYDFDLDFYKKELQNPSTKMIYLIADINRLKYTNDQFGHLEGDRLIEKAANVLSNSLKTCTKLYRIGGDEFAAIYINTDLETVKMEVSSIKANTELDEIETKIPLNLSIGFAINEPLESFDSIANRADTNMYNEKARYYKETGFERRTN